MIGDKMMIGVFFLGALAYIAVSFLIAVLPGPRK